MLNVIFISIILFFTNSFAGGVNGGGTDHLPPDFNAAWFLDGKPARSVSVCIKHDPEQFPMNPELIKAPFLKAVGRWKDYISLRGINDEQIRDDDIDPVYLSLVTDFQFIDNCSQADLEIYLGLVTPEIEQIKNSMFDPYAFVYRDSYDRKKGWGKGKMWLKGKNEKGEFFWDKNDFLNLEGILLHELGHVFGIEHMEGTVMDAEFSEKLNIYPLSSDDFMYQWLKYYMTNIDWHNELVQNLFKIKSFPEGSLWLMGSKAERESFRFLTGVLPSGAVKVNMKFEVRSLESEQIEGSYTLTDDKLSVTYPLVFQTSTINLVFNGRHIFRRYLEFDENNEEESNLLSFGTTSDYRLVSLAGYIEIQNLKHPILLEGLVSDWVNSQYSEDQTDEYIVRKLPYRLIGFEGPIRHILYGKYEIFNGNTPRNRQKLMKKLITTKKIIRKN